ncbi:MAG TPA: hypothetical protein VK306_14925 [Acidimicrobiales bacterium]|nr:hypothetical protein [Acidimicrobiales bacterium]
MAPDPDQMQQRLDDLEAGIEATRERAEADGLLPEDDPEDRNPTLADPHPATPGDEGIPGEATG